ncbi:glycoside hydrolase family 99-like domain-containing protein [Caulobacter sp. UNC279MFTsu5.1]|uniref:glycoside hydrolase family 99-like domain-containing protein n=1 Tax=Caulobacter sp. UNC279MFTsu5.1 TaxID=1502775 RepID=UPI000366FBAD|nr:glycoside hydrolase family 99-like domain-containing protein [Caulobacter sp. UNC279MFTsu5.1]SFJ46931.1 Lipopolysaccharide biosynthesis protein [Caulobacter sp. UNC279MFTsu5.1]
MMSSIPAPLKDVIAGDQPGVFVATGDDPQMLWKTPKDRVDLRERAAVRVTATFEVLEGQIVDPCVYADWGDGFSPQTHKPLSLVSDGTYTGAVYSDAGDLRRLRFDPSTTSCRFRLEAFTVEPAAEASHRVPHLSAARRGLRAALRFMPAGLRGWVRAGLSLLRGDFHARAIKAQFLRLNGRPWRTTYVRASEVARNLRSPDFAAPPLEPPRRAIDGPRTVAFYLPQFHPIAENDAWWGQGFTEWANVAKAVPQFVGHLQPRLPADLGYYDLRVRDVQRAQADLARRSGVDAFCFHYYWFAGKRLLEKPLDAFVDDPEITLPFALCWANENWTRRWDGDEGQILIGQKHSPEDDYAVLDDLARYMRSPRYLRVGDRPLLIVYRPDALPDARATVVRWRERARAIGIGEIYVACTNAFGFSDYKASDFDSLVEFPPHALAQGEMTDQILPLNSDFSGRVYDYGQVVAAKAVDLAELRDTQRKPGVMPSWDNEARKPGAGHVFHNATPERFHYWMRSALTAAARAPRPDERLVFINAWNEWAEGAYLEPDRWYGHAFAQALRSALEADAPRLGVDQGRSDVVCGSAGRARAVVLLHLHYAELIEEFAGRLAPLRGVMDTSITFPETWSSQELERLKAAFPLARLTPVPNRGRDVAPFISELGWARTVGYSIFCKIHSKRSPHMARGDAWREALVSPLLDQASAVIERFEAEQDLGLLATAAARTPLGTHGVMHNNAKAMATLSTSLGFVVNAQTAFPAGTMFWGRTAAFDALATAAPLAFEPEMGRIDGTLAHALERAMGAIVTTSGRRVSWDL